MSPALLHHNASEQNGENEIIMKWWGDHYRPSSNSSEDLPRIDESMTLHNLKVVVLLLIGCVGAIIVGCLLFCMFYKNERILQTIPGTKEYKRRKKEPESFYPIPHLGTLRTNQDKTLTLLANPKLLGGRFGKPGRFKTKGIKPAITGLYAKKDSKESKDDDSNKEFKENKTKGKGQLQVEENNDKSDGSSFNESDGMDEYDATNNTFPAGGELEARKTKGKPKKRDKKRVRRLRKKNKFSTTIVTKGNVVLVSFNHSVQKIVLNEDEGISKNIW